MLCRTLPHKVCSYGTSDVGQVRPRNEDVWRAVGDYHFFTLADGMGGHNAGDVAAQEAVDWCCHTFDRVLGPEGQDRNSLEEILAVLRFVVKDVNKHVYRLSRSDPALDGMGTTLCCCFFVGNHMLYAHVGDSRIYRWRDGELHRLTRDHSLVRWMVDLNGLTEEAALRVVSRHVLTKAIGMDPYIDPSLDMTAVKPGDWYFMCSDGLTDPMPEVDIALVLEQHSDGSVAAEALVHEVQKRGAPDNVTVLMMTVEDEPDGSDISR